MLILIYLTLFVLVPYFILLFFYKIWWDDIFPYGAPTKSFRIILEEKGGRIVEEELPVPDTRITVIIPARNEEKNIAICLQSLAAQTYSAELLQIIVVNDHSTDNTAQTVQNFPAANITLINLSDHITGPINSYKKKAIEVAIEQATGDLIVTTDADCTAPPGWIENMGFAYSRYNPAFIAGPVRLVPPSGRKRKSLLFIFQALDFMALQGVTGASVHKRFHSMCNGANLAYKKRAFYEVNGFNGIDAIASGDDMLLMHKIFRKYPDRIMYLKNPNAIVDTQAAGTWKEFLHQRIRWASKADKYEDKRIGIVLSLVYALNALLLLLFLGCIVYPEWLYNALIILGTKIMWEMMFMYPIARFFGMQRLMIWFPLMQPLHILYTVIAGFFGKFGRYSWKGRKVK